MTAVPAAALRSLRDDGPLAALAPRLAASPALLAVIGTAPWLVVICLLDDNDPLWPAGAALAWLVLWGLAGAAAPVRRGFDWTAAPLLRLAEYVGLVRLAVLADGYAVDAAYALVAVLALRHYDAVYRAPVDDSERRRREWRSGGWPLRLAAAYLVTVLDVVRPAYFAAAGALLVLFLAEAVAYWRDPGRRHGAPAAGVGEAL
jgi:hypothetical protein